VRPAWGTPPLTGCSTSWLDDSVPGHLGLIAIAIPELLRQLRGIVIPPSNVTPNTA
jgi:hypothetical protein